MMPTRIYAVLLVLTMSAMGSSGRAGEDAGQLDVSCELLQKDYALREPILLKLTFKNNSKERIDISRPVLGKTLLIEVVAGATKIEMKGGDAPVENAEPVSVAPGKQVYRLLNLNQYFNLQKIGDYKVLVRYLPAENALPTKPREFNDIGVVIRRPSRLEASAIKEVDPRLETLPCSAYQVAAARIILFYRESAYYRYAWYWLGRAAEQDFLDEEAVTCYEKALKETPQCPWREELAYRLLRLQERMGKASDGGRALEDLLNTTEDLDVKAMIRAYISSQEHLRRAG
jgi:tetratricopeptide (TPR) repeat protein